MSRLEALGVEAANEIRKFDGFQRSTHRRVDPEALYEQLSNSSMLQATLQTTMQSAVDGKLFDAPQHDPASYLGSIQQFAANAQKWILEKCPQYASQLINSIKQQLESIKTPTALKDPRTRLILGNLVFAYALVAMGTFIISCSEGKSWSDCFSSVMPTLLPTALISLLTSLIQIFLMPVEWMKTVLTSVLHPEITVASLNAMATGIVGFVWGVAWDVVAVLFRKRDPRQSWREYLAKVGAELRDTLLTIVERNLVFAGSVTLVYTLCPVWATLLIALFLPSLLLYFYKSAQIDGHQTLIGAFLCRIADVAFGFLPPPDRPNVPPALLCQITEEVLDDPVYLRHYIVSRRVAEQQVRTRGVDFHNVPAVLDDIKSMPTLNTIVKNARALLTM